MGETTEISIHDPQALQRTVEVLRSDYPVVMVELPSVYALISPASLRGVSALDHAKARLPQKNYGSVIGLLESFAALAQPDTLPSFWKDGSNFNLLEGAFIRLSVTASHFSSAALRSGSHQGLLLPEGAFRALFRTLARELVSDCDAELFGGKPYSGVLCSSANLSGDSAGSITDPVSAAQFAQARRIPLWIRGDEMSTEKGSYPILSLSSEGVTIARGGPHLNRILNRLPRSIRVHDLSEQKGSS